MSDEKIISANSSDKKISCSFCGKSQEEVKKFGLIDKVITTRIEK